MTEQSSGEQFHEAVRGARSIVSRIRENGLMKDSEFKWGFYQPCTRSAKSEADQLEKYLDAIVAARFKDGLTHPVKDAGPTKQVDAADDPAF